MAPIGQILAQIPQLVQFSSTSIQVSTNSSAPGGHTPTHAPQYPHLNLFTLMATYLSPVLK
jgi:hypothetical protein